MRLICYKKCTTCKDVEQMLEKKGISYDYRDIKEDNPKASELKTWHENLLTKVKEKSKLILLFSLLFRV